MPEATWYRQLVPALLAMALIPLARAPAALQPATAADQWVGATLPCSVSRDGPVAGSSRPSGRLLERTARDGSLLGYRLELSGAAGGAARRIDLPAEAFLSGPVGPAFLVGSDDGRLSRLRLVSPAAGCTRTLATSAGAILRRAVVDPQGRWLAALQLERGTRRDLGVHRRPLEGGPWQQLLEPFAEAAPAVARRIGRPYATSLAWSDDGSMLAVQTCGAIECASRVVGVRSTLLLAEPGQGPLVALTGDALLVMSACAGLPCPGLRLPLSAGEVLR